MANVPTPCTTPAVPILSANSGSNHQPVLGPMSARYSSTTAPIPLGQILQSGLVGTAYSETISAVNGTSPYAFSLVTGTLPAGCSLNSSTGVISGTPTVVGTYNFTIKITDANGLIGNQVFQISISTSGGGNYAWAY